MSRGTYDTGVTLPKPGRRNAELEFASLLRVVSCVVPGSPAEAPTLLLRTLGPRRVLERISEVIYDVPTGAGPQRLRSASRNAGFPVEIEARMGPMRPFTVRVAVRVGNDPARHVTAHRVAFFRSTPPGALRRVMGRVAVRIRPGGGVLPHLPAARFQVPPTPPPPSRTGIVQTPLSTYVPRAIDNELQRALTADGGPPLVVVRGARGSGKTRTALHAAQALDAQIILVPEGVALRDIVYRLPNAGRGPQVLWLDDLGPRLREGLSLPDLQLLFGVAPGLRAVATLDTADEAAIREREVDSRASLVLGASARVIDLPDRMTTDERKELERLYPSARFNQTYAARPLRLVPDVPAEGVLGLGFEGHATVLAAAVRGVEPPIATVGLFGEWGSGKSTLLRRLEDLLSGAPEITAVWFDAWRYQHLDTIIVPLLNVIAQSLSRQEGDPMADRLRRVAQAVAASASIGIAGVATLEVDQRGFREALRRPAHRLARTPGALEDALSGLSAEARRLDGRRIVVLVDDLDRCAPRRVTQLLEDINVVLGLPGFVFVLALDHGVLTRAVRVSYPHLANPEGFVEKMIDVPFHLPPVSLDGRQQIVALLPAWDEITRQLPDLLAESLQRMIVSRDAGNPRQIKRTINSVLLTTRMMEALEQASHETFAEQDYALVGVLAVLRLRWPDLYERALQPVMRGREQDAMRILGELASDDGAGVFLRTYLPDLPTPGTLARVMRLADVATTVPPVGHP